MDAHVACCHYWQFAGLSKFKTQDDSIAVRRREMQRGGLGKTDIDGSLMAGSSLCESWASSA